MKTEYWFVLKQSVFVWIKGNECYFYDSVSFVGQRFMLKDSETIRFVEALVDMDNLYSLSLKQEDLKVTGIQLVVEKLETLGWAKLINKCDVNGRPIQLPPVLNLQSDVRRLEDGTQTDMTTGDGVLKNLQVLTLKLDDNLTPLFINKLIGLLKDVSHVSLMELVIYGYSSSLSIPEDFWLQLETLPCLKRFVLNLNEVSCRLVKQLKGHISSHLFFEFEIVPNTFSLQLMEDLRRMEVDFKYSFRIFSEEDFEWATKLIENYQIEEYLINPVYTGRNLDFFQSCIYVEERDILDSRQTKQNIFAHQALNTNDFGKLTITTDGKVYANCHYPAIGSVDEDIRLLVYREMTKGTSWLRVRDMKPCSDCVFQWLCPSPSDYELEIGKTNLCHVVEDK